MKNLITYEEISKLARPCTSDRELAEAMIAEAQRVEIKPRLGDELYIKILESVGSSNGGASVNSGRVYHGGSASYASGNLLRGSGVAGTILVGLADSAIDSRFKVLVQGGKWIARDGSMKLLSGLKTALAYYTLARLVRDGNIRVTTYGSVIKDDQYSAEAEKQERQRQYRELFEQADTYMAEVISYLTCNTGLIPEYKVAGKMRSNRFTIRIIGK